VKKQDSEIDDVSTDDHGRTIFIFLHSKLLWLQYSNFILTFVEKQQKRTPMENTYIRNLLLAAMQLVGF